MFFIFSDQPIWNWCDLCICILLGLNLAGQLTIKQDYEIITFCERGLIFSAFFFFILLFDVWTSEIRDTVVFLLQWCGIFLVYFLEGWKVDVLVLQYGIQNSKRNTFLLVLGFFKWYSCHHRYSAELSSMKIALKYNNILIKTYFVAIKGNVIFPLNSDTPDVERGCS